MQIAIVTDNPEQLAVLRALALDAGLEQVKCFTHPAAALDWCAEHEPDLVLADYMMRACDGLEFLRRFRAMPHLGSASIILVLPSMLGLAGVRASAWQLGVTDFLGTPVDNTEFVARVRNLLLLRAATKSRPPAPSAGPLANSVGSRWQETPPAAKPPNLAQFH